MFCSGSARHRLRTLTQPYFERVALSGSDGWDAEGVVEEVVRLERWGLVLIATDDPAYLITGEDFDHPSA